MPSDKTNTRGMDPDTLAAFVDGELSPEDAALVIMQLSKAPEDQAVVDAVTRLNQILAKAYDAPMHEPVPQRILDTIRAGADAAETTVVPFRRRAVPAPMLGGALAAGLALAIGIWSWTGLDEAPVIREGAVASASGLNALLETAATGDVASLDADGGEATVLSTFMDATGRPCREFEVMSGETLERGIACREAGSWTVAARVTVPEPPVMDDGTFLPAAGDADDELSAALDELGAGMMLTHEEEAALIASGWEG